MAQLRADWAYLQGGDNMRRHSAKSLAILSLGGVFVLAANVNCGEFLLLHFLCCPDCGAARLAELEDSNESPTPTVIVQETVQNSPTVVEGELEHDTSGQHIPPQAPCAKGDLNGDGKVDGLDIQVLVNCLLQQ